MQTLNDAILREFWKLLNERINTLVENISNSQAVSSFEHYRILAGRIEGLRLVPEIWSEAEDKAAGKVEEK